MVTPSKISILNFSILVIFYTRYAPVKVYSQIFTIDIRDQVDGDQIHSYIS